MGYALRAGIWATCPDANFRNGKKAVASATKALDLDPKNAIVMNVLASAYAETGDFAEAVRWQEQALMDPQYRDNSDMQRRLELYRNKMPYRAEY